MPLHWYGDGGQHLSPEVGPPLSPQGASFGSPGHHGDVCDEIGGYTPPPGSSVHYQGGGLEFQYQEVPAGTALDRRVSGWLPKDRSVLQQWLTARIEKVDQHMKEFPSDEPPARVIQEFQALIEEDPVIYMGFHQMFEQIPMMPPYDRDPTGKPQVRDYKTMLTLFNGVLKEAPRFEKNKFAGFPISAILEWPMGTPAGYLMFTNDKVNKMIKKMFHEWTTFLRSPESCNVLTDDDHGWFSKSAREVIPDFDELYVCDPTKPYHGFKSWDDFFTRKFRPGVRPIVPPGDEDDYITSACESTLYCRARDVKERDQFWLKGQPYSLAHMLNNDELVHHFAGGTVYQAFLCGTAYHRWHSPVNGVIEKVVPIEGTYYAESPAMGFDPVGPDNSQAFITAMATRTLIFIRAENKAIGLMCFVGVGMCEVSTCEARVTAGQKVSKGDEIGMFHYGGSTYCLIFRPETKVAFMHGYEIGDNVMLNSVIAKVSRA